MRFILGDILDIPADGLISSGNVQLTMSGGINGALLLRYGEDLQRELHEALRTLEKPVVEPGHVYLFNQPIGDYKAVAYAVAIDGWYDSSVELVVQTLIRATAALITNGCQSMTVGALATSSGHLNKADFGRALYQWERTLPSGLDCMLVECNEVGLDEIRAAYYDLLDRGDV